ncbi:MAG TPA: alkaline phosphatase family protein, partial [Actinomycetota bacterium]|nr:alkaline phosphatase family protein [Actinomycetota bacterium]
RADLARVNLRPAMVDLYERARDNEPVVGMIGSLGAIGMIGRGAGFPGGDRDVVAGQTLDGWRLSPSGRPLYRFPRYVRSVPGLARELRRLDLADGKLDRSWRGRPFPPDVSELPAFAPYQTSVVRELIRRERFGRDRVPDFLFVNYKQIDKIGHRSSMNSSEMAAAVRSSDAALGTIVRMLDREVGRGRWVLALTADHGATPDRSVTGGPALDTQDLYADLLARFDRDGDDVPAIQSARLTQIWVDETELAENGFEVEDVARFLARYRVSDNAGSGMPAGRPDRTAFTAAFPSEVLKDLACLRDTKRRNG